MNYKKFILALPIIFFACESEEDDPTLLGLWTATSFEGYASTTCSGTPESTLESMSAIFGDDFSLTMNFTADEVILGSSASLAASALCSMLFGTLDGDSCGISLFGTTINMPVDSMCFDMGGTYANSNCTITNSETSSYSTDGDAITVTHAAGTDSAEVETGTWSISGDVLTMSIAGDSSCTNFTLSK